MNTLRSLTLALALTGCAGSRVATCTAYDAAVVPARALCHRACDAIPSSCPWADSPTLEGE